MIGVRGTHHRQQEYDPCLRTNVQLIDLGPPEGLILQRPTRDRRESLQTRGINE
jgi:hypothetical protein